MTEGMVVKARAAADLEIEPLLRIFKHTLIETYMKGFVKGTESMEDEDAALQRLNEEAEALASGTVQTEQEREFEDFCAAEGANPEAMKAMARSLKMAGFDIKEVPDDGPLVRLKPDAVLKRRLKQEDFSVRAWKTLKVLNIETLGDILQVSEKFYLSQKGFGKNCLNELKEYVERFGYELKES